MSRYKERYRIQDIGTATMIWWLDKNYLKIIAIYCPMLPGQEKIQQNRGKKCDTWVDTISYYQICFDLKK